MWRIIPLPANPNSTAGMIVRIPCLSPTTPTGTPQLSERKNGARSGKSRRNRDSSPKLLGQFIQQPGQILVALTDHFDLVYRVKHSCVVLAAELPPNFRQ